MNDIKDWLISEMDYQQGVEIFAKYCPNRMYVRNFQRGNAKTNLKKLEYEMKRLLGIPLFAITSQTCSNQQLVNNVTERTNPQKTAPVTHTQHTAKQTPYPNDIITQAKALRNELHTQIVTIHKELFDLGEDNTDAIVEKRKNLLNKRIPIIKKHETIYALIEEYFITMIIPDGLKTMLSEPAVPENDKKDFDKLSDILLFRMKNKLASKLSRLKNLLQFQTYNAQKTPNPMPEGSKKKDIENRLKEITEDYKTVVKLIEKRK